MNISPQTGKPKIVAADKTTVERFSRFCGMLVTYKDAFDFPAVGENAEAAKSAVDKLLESIKLEMTPKHKRPELPADESSDASEAEEPTV